MMQDRPPPPGPDDDLDFDFDAPRRRHHERGDTGERRPDDSLEPDLAADAPRGGDEPGGDEREPGTDSGELDSLETAERPARRERGRSKRGLRLPGRGRRREERARRAADTAGLEGAGAGEGLAVDEGAGEGPAAEGAPAAAAEDPYARPRKHPPPRNWRERHRALPAAVRRRQAVAAGVIGVIVIGGGYALASSLFGGGESDEPLPLKRVVGQTVIGKLGKDGPDRKTVRRVKKGQVGGFIVNPRSEQALQEQVGRLQAAAEAGGNPPLLILIDQEGGPVKRLPGPPDVSAPELGRDGSTDAARSVGEATGAYLQPLGISGDLAPVLDVALPRTADTIANRTLGDDPALVSSLGSAFIQGLQSQKVAATAKHFPGLGPATVNTDFSPVTIAARPQDLDAALQPFRAAVEAGVEMVMVASASYPALGADKPASFSGAIVRGLLRGDLGFEGVVITDDLQSVAIQELTTSGAAAVSSLGAGCDLLLFAGTPKGSVSGFNAAVKAAKQGKLTRSELDAAYERITALKGALG